jgi:hypothetical protein
MRRFPAVVPIWNGSHKLVASATKESRRIMRQNDWRIWAALGSSVIARSEATKLSGRSAVSFWIASLRSQ